VKTYYLGSKLFFVAALSQRVLVVVSPLKSPSLVAFRREVYYAWRCFWFINDVADVFGDLSVSLSLFADDLKLHTWYKADILHDALHTAKNRLTEWAKLWQLQIAIPKCSAFRISNPQWNVCESVQQVTYSIDGVPLRSAGGHIVSPPWGRYLVSATLFGLLLQVVCLLPPWALHKRQVVLEICSQTDIQTHRQTRSSQ